MLDVGGKEDGINVDVMVTSDGTVEIGRAPDLIVRASDVKDTVDPGMGGTDVVDMRGTANDIVDVR